MTETSRKNLLSDAPRWTRDQGPILRLEGVTKSFGDLMVLDGVDLEIWPGEITVILGASGSGKTVLMKMFNGLHKPDSGEVFVFGQAISAMSDKELDDIVRKRVATMFQNYALFDSMTVAENVSFPLVQNKVASTAEARELAKKLLDELDLGDVLDEYPSSLSGGMKKRVALARTIVPNPELVLFECRAAGSRGQHDVCPAVVADQRDGRCAGAVETGVGSADGQPAADAEDRHRPSDARTLPAGAASLRLFHRGRPGFAQMRLRAAAEGGAGRELTTAPGVAACPACLPIPWHRAARLSFP